jgi:hypothetical protein
MPWLVAARSGKDSAGSDTIGPVGTSAVETTATVRPIHCIPSPPIWDRPVTVPACEESISSTRAWQPMPPPTSAPGSGLVEVLCGQPEQKYGTRLISGRVVWFPASGRPATTVSPRAIILRRSGPVIASASSSP